MNIHIQNQEHQTQIKNYLQFQNNLAYFESVLMEQNDFRFLDRIELHVYD